MAVDVCKLLLWILRNPISRRLCVELLPFGSAPVPMTVRFYNATAACHPFAPLPLF
jgi:hypothetical protein